MGIRLDWEIEADQQRIQGAGEDPNAQRTRRAARLRLFLTLALVLVLLGAAALFVYIRLEEVDQQIEILLRDTVTAEVAALRVGNWSAFSEFQRSASPDWLVRQRTLFDEYQQLILRNENAQLTGQILSVDIDDPRGRVQVQEIVDGVPYTRTWFYWRFEEEVNAEGDVTFEGGWRHVPPDYTFWGEPTTAVGDYVTVRHFTLDAPFAEMVNARLNEWVAVACEALDCANLPEIQVNIQPDDEMQVNWSLNNPWLLQMGSPYAVRARSDLPFAPELQIETASLLAQRMVQYATNDVVTVGQSDADYLVQATTTWLVGRFVLIDAGAYLIDSLATQYGTGVVGQLLRELQPGSEISLLSQFTGATLDQANLDWRDFFNWRLQVENAAIAAQNQERFATLYDLSDPAVQEIATTRFTQQITLSQPSVALVQPTTAAPDGEPQVVATVNTLQGDVAAQEMVIFRLVDNVWRRAS